MRTRRVTLMLLVLGVLSMMVFCDEGGLEIEGPIPDDPSLAPGESTVLHCEVIAPSGEVVYVWEADTGNIEGLGDSAIWTAPEDLTWVNYIATITVTAEDEEDNMGEESVEMAVRVNRHDVQATDDTYTFEHDPTTSYVDSSWMFVGYSSEWSAVFHSFVKFTTPVIPAGETLQAARIKLIREYGDGEECELAIELITEDWQGSNVTWESEPASEEWIVVSDNSSDKGTFYIAITSLVSDWIDGERENYGFMLRLNDESGADVSFRNYVTIEGPSDEHPVIEVVPW